MKKENEQLRTLTELAKPVRGSRILPRLICEACIVAFCATIQCACARIDDHESEQEMSQAISRNEESQSGENAVTSVSRVSQIDDLRSDIGITALHLRREIEEGRLPVEQVSSIDFTKGDIVPVPRHGSVIRVHFASDTEIGLSATRRDVRPESFANWEEMRRFLDIYAHERANEIQIEYMAKQQDVYEDRLVWVLHGRDYTEKALERLYDLDEHARSMIEDPPPAP